MNQTFNFENNHIIKLKHDNKKGLVDYCGCVPEIWARSATFTGVRRGFLANGMVDDTLKICPVWEDMIGTMPRKMSNAEMLMSKDFENIKTAFIDKKMNDIVNEETYDALNFPIDKDSRGAAHDEIRRTDYIPCQRARTIGPEEMRQIHREQTEKFKGTLIQKNLKVRQESENHMISNEECEEILKKN